jgi:xanthine dehydrogenase large subunit
MLAISVYEALRDAVAQAGGRAEHLNAPATAQEILQAMSPGP